MGEDSLQVLEDLVPKFSPECDCGWCVVCPMTVCVRMQLTSFGDHSVQVCVCVCTHALHTV